MMKYSCNAFLMLLQVFHWPLHYLHISIERSLWGVRRSEVRVTWSFLLTITLR